MVASSSLPESDEIAGARTERRWRLVFAIVLFVFLGAGLLGRFDPRESSTQAAASGILLTVEFAERSRPGLATSWEAQIESLDGGELPEELTVTTTASYFDLFDENSLDPEPESAYQDADNVAWTYRPPPGSTVLNISFDARLAPTWQRGATAETAVVVDGMTLVAVRYQTTVVP